MSKRHLLTHFVARNTYSALLFAGATFLCTLALDAAITRSIPTRIMHRVYACSVVFVLFYIRCWILRDKLARIDSYQAHTYLQNMRMREAVESLEKQLAGCEHNFDAEHEQCIAFSRLQLRLIKHTLGHGPDPVLIHGSIEVHPHCINVVHGVARCQHMEECQAMQA